MPTYTWNFDSNSRDTNGLHPWKKLTDGTEVGVTGGKLLATTSALVCDISDISVDSSQRWRILAYMRDDASHSTVDTYMLSVGPVMKNSGLGGFVVWRPANQASIAMDNSPCKHDLQRICYSRGSFGDTWYPPYEITYDGGSSIRRLALYREGIRVSTSPIGNFPDPDTTHRFLYLGGLLDTECTPTSLDYLVLETDWNGTMSSYPVTLSHKYLLVRLQGACTILEAGLDGNRSSTTDDGVTIRSTTTLTVTEGDASGTLTNLYNKLYSTSVALTPKSSTGWTTIQYSDSTGFDALQLRLAALSGDPIPTWCELSYSVDGRTWFLEDRFQILATHFQTSGSRANLCATYQRTASSGVWAYVRSYGL